MFRSCILIIIFSSCLCAQKAINYKEFNFFNLSPSHKVAFKKFGNCSFKESDSLLSVVFYEKGSRDYEINIKKEIIPYSLNYDSDCCSGRIRASKRLYKEEKIVEYNYYSPHETFKNFDSLNLRSIRMMTKDSIIINYYDTLFEVKESVDITVIELDSVVNKIKPKRTSRYAYKSGMYKLGVGKYDIYESEVYAVFNGFSESKTGQKSNIVYIPSLFAYKWWAVEAMPCNEIWFRVRYSKR